MAVKVNQSNQPLGTVLRFTLSERIQHILLMTCLIILALTGLSLRYYDTAWGRFMIALEGGLEGRGLIHRWAAAVLLSVSVYHYTYTLLNERGHRFLMDLLPIREDWANLARGLRYNLGVTEQPPDWGKFTLFQKAQYFGVIAGILSMALTGIVLWLGLPAIALIPKWLMDLTLVIHGSEGLLIFILLFFWHLYNVHLAPGNFPMDMSWLTGRVPLDRYRERHPAEYRRLTSSSEGSR